jgi:hypothetical protein
MKSRIISGLLASMIAVGLSVAGCQRGESEGPAEKAGKQMDEGMEHAGEQMKETAGDVGEAMEDTGEKMQEKVGE